MNLTKAIMTLIIGSLLCLFCSLPVFAQDTNGNDVPDACEETMPGYDPSDPDEDGLNYSCEVALAHKLVPTLPREECNTRRSASSLQKVNILSHGMVKIVRA